MFRLMTLSSSFHCNNTPNLLHHVFFNVFPLSSLQSHRAYRFRIVFTLQRQGFYTSFRDVFSLCFYTQIYYISICSASLFSTCHAAKIALACREELCCRQNVSCPQETVFTSGSSTYLFLCTFSTDSTLMALRDVRSYTRNVYLLIVPQTLITKPNEFLHSALQAFDIKHRFVYCLQ